LVDRCPHHPQVTPAAAAAIDHLQKERKGEKERERVREREEQ